MKVKFFAQIVRQLSHKAMIKANGPQKSASFHRHSSDSREVDSADD